MNSFRFLKLQTVFFKLAESLSLDNLDYLFIYLCNVVCKLFFKIFHTLKFGSDSFHITQVVSPSACGRCGDTAIFGNMATINIFLKKMVLHIVTQQIIF